MSEEIPNPDIKEKLEKLLEKGEGLQMCLRGKGSESNQTTITYVFNTKKKTDAGLLLDWSVSGIIWDDGDDIEFAAKNQHTSLDFC